MSYFEYQAVVFNLSVHLHVPVAHWFWYMKDLAIWFWRIWCYLDCLPPSRNPPLHGSTVLFLTYLRSFSWRTLPPSKWKLACWYGNSLTYGECLEGQRVATPGHFVAPDMIEVKKQRAEVIWQNMVILFESKRGACKSKQDLCGFLIFMGDCLVILDSHERCTVVQLWILTETKQKHRHPARAWPKAPWFKLERAVA